MDKSYIIAVRQVSSGMEGQRFVKSVIAQDNTEFKIVAFKFPFGIKTLSECLEDNDYVVVLSVHL